MQLKYPGRPFLCCLTDLLQGNHSPFVRLNQDTHADLKWWLTFLKDWNGVSLFISPCWSQLSDLQVATDAVGSVGFGAYLDGRWFAHRWLASRLPASIAVKELYPIVLAAHVWGHQWAGLRVQFLCDNLGMATAISRRFCRDASLGALLCSLFLTAARHSFWVSAIHVPGRTNSIADSLSRFNFHKFCHLAPQARLEPTPLQAHLLKLLDSQISPSVCPPTSN